MSSPFKNIGVELSLRYAQFTAGLGTASRSVHTFGADLAKVGQMSSADLNTIGNKALIAGAAVAAGLGIAAKSFLDFDATMSEVGATSDATVEELAQLREAALEAGAATVFSATEAAQAQVELAKAGVSTADILGGALTGALNLAAAGGLGLADAAAIAANAMTVFNLTGADVTGIADTLAAAANKSATDVGEMGQALAQGGLVASQYGLTVEETAGALAEFAQSGLRGSDAGTSLKTMLMRLVPQSNEARQAMEDMGLEFFDAQGQFVGMSGVAEQLQTKLGGLSQKQQAATLQTIFGSDAIRGATILMQDGAEGVDQWTEAVSDSGYAAELAAKKNDNLRGDLEQLRGSIETALIGAGSEANGVLRAMTQELTGLVNFMGDLPGPVQTAAVGIAAFSAAGLLAVGVGAKMITAWREVNSVLNIGSAFETGALRVSYFKDSVDQAIIGLTTAEGTVNKLRASGDLAKVALGGIGSALSTLAVPAALALVAIEIDQFANRANAGKAAAEEFFETLGDFDASSQSSVIDSLSRLNAELTRLDQMSFKKATFGDYAAAWADIVVPVQDVEGSLNDTGAAMDAIKDKIAEQEAAYALWMDAAYDVSQALDGMAGKDVLAWMNKLKLDPETMSVENMAKAIDSARIAAENGTPSTDGLAEAYGSVADQTASATDRLKAYKDAMDAVIGVHLSAFEAETKWARGLGDLAKELLENGLTLDANTEKGQANRDALSGAAQAALDHAQAVAEETGDVNAANGVLGNHVIQLLGVMTQMGFTDQQARDYINTLGLTPENLMTLIALNGADAAQTALNNMQSVMREIDGKTINVTLNVMGGGAYMDDLGRLVHTSGKKAGGGWAAPHTFHEVAEPGYGPELLQSGGRTYLMTGAQGGFVTPANQTAAMFGGAGPVSIGDVTIVAKGVTASEVRSEIASGLAELVSDVIAEVRAR